MKDIVRVLLVVIAASLLGACGGGGTSAAPSVGTAVTPVAESHDWDSWNWDEGSFGD